jgi:hypothetical protein
MGIQDKKLFVLPFPQRIEFDENVAENNKLVCNVVVLPRNSPFDNLTDDGNASFATGTFTLKAWLVKGNSDSLPSSGNHAGDSKYQHKEKLVKQNTNRQEVFDALKALFDIEPSPAGLTGKQPVTLRKYLPEAYRNAFTFTQPKTGNAVTDDSYFCSLKINDFATPYVANDKVSWAQILAFALSQPLLAKALGILYTNIEIQLDNADFYKEGGWVYFDFDETDDENTNIHLTADDANVNFYTARISAITESRQIFAPVLFPVLHINDDGSEEATVTFDDVFKDVVQYDDGFAKIVHCSQAINTNPILETKDGPSPLMDTGIRLGWDDEQILTWLIRSYDETHVPAASEKAHSKLTVSRYRIDAAEISKHAFDTDDISVTEREIGNRWKSQVAISSKNTLSLTPEISLGDFKGETGVQISPARSSSNDRQLWLPAFFTFWNGTSLALPDPIPDEINKLTAYKKTQPQTKANNDPPALYDQTPGTKVELKYGHHYAFRVRLSDISGGGPAVEDKTLHPGENHICKHTFTRNVAPSPPTVTNQENGLKIIRSRLGYPAILFTSADTASAIELLKQDRKALDDLSKDLIDPATKKYIVNDNSFELFKKASREVSIADPDVDKIHIIVEVATLDMDREASYNALHSKTPKEPYILLYETLRSFNDYTLSLNDADHTLDLPFEFRDVPVISFNEGQHPDDLGLGADISNQSGPLILPTARKLRITIRSFCSEEHTEYFGHQDFRFSTPVKKDIRRDIENLEAGLLSAAAGDPLLSFFFRPESPKTPEEMRAAAARGEQNQADVNIVERLASICALEKHGLSVQGKQDERVQFGCSNLIGHTLSPDNSSVTFASIDDLSRKWISVIQLELNRDWCWDMLNADSFEVFRQWKYKRDDGITFDINEERIGVIGLTKGLNWQNFPQPDRSKTRLVFIDALDPKPGAVPVGATQLPAAFPELLELRYRVSPKFNKAINFDAAAYEYTTQPYNLEIILPIATPPSQVPEIVSAGLAFSEFDSDQQLFDNQYSSTSEQLKYLWIEFAEPVQDLNDAYFTRLLSYAPDPAIANFSVDVNKEMDEPAINLDPEIVRIIRPSQIADKAGHDSMMPLVGATADVDGHSEGVRHFLLPLQSGLTADSPELFGFFTYEFRIGHAQWSLEQAFVGRPLRVTGIQHPAPRLRLSTIKDAETIKVSAVFAESFFNGINCTPFFPRTTIYALLYAQVLQADGKQFRNILIDQISLEKPQRNDNIDKPLGTTSWQLKAIRTKLLQKGMDINSPLSVLAIEVMPDGRQGDFPVNSIIDLEKTRILRSSKLYKIADSCPV